MKRHRPLSVFLAFQTTKVSLNAFVDLLRLAKYKLAGVEKALRSQ